MTLEWIRALYAPVTRVVYTLPSWSYLIPKPFSNRRNNHVCKQARFLLTSNYIQHYLLHYRCKYDTSLNKAANVCISPRSSAFIPHRNAGFKPCCAVAVAKELGFWTRITRAMKVQNPFRTYTGNKPELPHKSTHSYLSLPCLLSDLSYSRLKRSRLRERERKDSGTQADIAPVL